jgi:hypothetical protein
MIRARDTCESRPSLDIRRLSRENKLWPTFSFVESWIRAGEPFGSVRVTNELDRVVLSFRYQDEVSADWRDVVRKVSVAWTACSLAGGRPWFVCPVAACGRRVALIYLGEAGVFACRKCHDLAYATQFEPIGRRGIERARRIRMKLNGGPNLGDSFPERPKGMHRKSYLRLRSAYEKAASRCGAL